MAQADKTEEKSTAFKENEYPIYANLVGNCSFSTNFYQPGSYANQIDQCSAQVLRFLNWLSYKNFFALAASPLALAI